MAGRHKVAIVCISHLNKSSNGNALYRTMGSLAFTAAARAAYLVSKDQDHPDRRLFLPIKNNLAKDSTGLAYTVVTAENGAPVIVWEPDVIETTAAEALAVPVNNEERTETDWAVNFLEDILRDGPKPAVEIAKEARRAGVKDKALRRAKEKLKVIPKKSTFSGGWICQLPDTQDAHALEDAHLKMEGNFDPQGQFRSIDGSI
jgi:hypothetical protein